MGQVRGPCKVRAKGCKGVAASENAEHPTWKWRNAKNAGESKAGDKDYGGIETVWDAGTTDCVVDVCGNGACKRLSVRARDGPPAAADEGRGRSSSPRCSSNRQARCSSRRARSGSQYGSLRSDRFERRNDSGSDGVELLRKHRRPSARGRPARWLRTCK